MFPQELIEVESIDPSRDDSSLRITDVTAPLGGLFGSTTFSSISGAVLIELDEARARGAIPSHAQSIEQLRKPLRWIHAQTIVRDQDPLRMHTYLCGDDSVGQCNLKGDLVIFADSYRCVRPV